MSKFNTCLFPSRMCQNLTLYGDHVTYTIKVEFVSLLINGRKDIVHLHNKDKMSVTYKYWNKPVIICDQRIISCH